jgi:transcriptional regulator with XRE-family HTH domain
MSDLSKESAGARLLALRAERDVSQELLANLLKTRWPGFRVSYSSLSLAERGQRTRWETYQRLARYFGHDIQIRWVEPGQSCVVLDAPEVAQLDDIRGLGPVQREVLDELVSILPRLPPTILATLQIMLAGWAASFQEPVGEQEPGPVEAVGAVTSS